MHDGMLDDVIPSLATESAASEPKLAAGTINRISGSGQSVQIWAVIDGFDGYEWGPLEHRPFAEGESPIVGARCAVGIFADEKWLVGLDETVVTAATWYTGTTAPGSGLGAEGDLYLDTTANAWYGPKHTGAWGAAHPLTRAPAFLVGTGVPGSGLGSDGDSYLDRATGLLYAPKATGAWPAGAALPNAVQIGALQDWAAPARSIPSLWLACFGQSLLRTTYAALFAALCPVVATGTVTLASPGVWTTGSAHGLVIGDPVFLTTTGALPTGMSANTAYYVMTVPSSTTFTLGTTRTVSAITGVATVTVAVNTSGSQSGVHTIVQAPWGIADATHFNAPDLRGRSTIGKDDMGGSNAGVLTWTRVAGLVAGEQAHLLLTGEAAQKAVTSNSENADHHHDTRGATAAGGSGGNFVPPTNTTDSGGVTSSGGVSTNHQHTITGSDSTTAHNTVPPGAIVNKIIYAGA